jgi:hypothetical protein
MRYLKYVTATVVILVWPLIVRGAEPVKAKAATPTKAAVVAYKPPLRGAPAGRVGGGTRGATERESFSLQALAPDHVGYTTQEQPCLYWYISKPTTYSIELTVATKKAVQPLIEKVVKGPEQGGIQSVCLADLGVKLAPNVQYKWFVTLVTDAEHRSKDILAGGIIEYAAPSASLLAKLKGVDSASHYAVYAEEGQWYDAIGSLSQSIAAAPGNTELQQQRAALLAQVGLGEVVAAIEKK